MPQVWLSTRGCNSTVIACFQQSSLFSLENFFGLGFVEMVQQNCLYEGEHLVYDRIEERWQGRVEE